MPAEAPQLWPRLHTLLLQNNAITALPCASSAHLIWEEEAREFRTVYWALRGSKELYCVLQGMCGSTATVFGSAIKKASYMFCDALNYSVDWHIAIFRTQNSLGKVTGAAGSACSV